MVSGRRRTGPGGLGFPAVSRLFSDLHGSPARGFRALLAPLCLPASPHPRPPCSWKRCCPSLQLPAPWPRPPRLGLHSGPRPAPSPRTRAHPSLEVLSPVRAGEPSASWASRSGAHGPPHHVHICVPAGTGWRGQPPAVGTREDGGLWPPVGSRLGSASAHLPSSRVARASFPNPVSFLTCLAQLATLPASRGCQVDYATSGGDVLRAGPGTLAGSAVAARLGQVSCLPAPGPSPSPGPALPRPGLLHPSSSWAAGPGQWQQGQVATCRRPGP